MRSSERPCLPLLGNKLEVVNIAWLLNDAVERTRPSARRRLGRRLVRLDLKHVGRIRAQAEWQAGRADAARVFTEYLELSAGRHGGRQLDLLLQLAGRVAQETDLDLLSELAAWGSAASRSGAGRCRRAAGTCRRRSAVGALAAPAGRTFRPPGSPPRRAGVLPKQRRSRCVAASSKRLASRMATYGSNSVFADRHALDLDADALPFLASKL